MLVNGVFNSNFNSSSNADEQDHCEKFFMLVPLSFTFIV